MLRGAPEVLNALPADGWKRPPGRDLATWAALVRP